MKQAMTKDRYWAKLDQSGDIHLLENHLADVGAVIERLLQCPAINRTTARTADRAQISDNLIGRIAAFASLHDIGKANPHFQSKSLPHSERCEPTASHTKDLMPLINGIDKQGHQNLLESIPWLTTALQQWDDQQGDVVCGMLTATISHHGRPERIQNGYYARTEHWEQHHLQQNPFTKIAEISASIESWFLKAFENSTEKLPSNPEFQHHYLGLLIWADWIASDKRLFPYEGSPRVDYINTARARAKNALKQLHIDIADQALPKEPAATKVTRTITDLTEEPKIVIAEVEQQPEKLEATAALFYKLRTSSIADGVYLAMPNEIAAIQVQPAWQTVLDQIMPDTDVTALLAISGQTPEGKSKENVVAEYEIESEDQLPPTGNSWSAEHPKRYMTAQFAVGTIDQAALSILQTNHAHLRAACLSRQLLVLDMDDNFEEYQLRLIAKLIKSHSSRGGHTLITSTGMNNRTKSILLETTTGTALAETSQQPYPSISTKQAVETIASTEQNKTVTVKIQKTAYPANKHAEIAIAAAAEGAKVLIIRNSTEEALETFTEIEKHEQEHFEESSLFRVRGTPTLFHEDYAQTDLHIIHETAITVFGERKSLAGHILVGSPALEQIVLDADVLITDLCQMEQMLRRIQKLHSNPLNPRPETYLKPECIVLPAKSSTHGANYKQDHAVPVAPKITSDDRTLAATRKQIEDRTKWALPKMTRELIEHATREKTTAFAKRSQEELDIEQERHLSRVVVDQITIDQSKPFYDPMTNDNPAVIFNKSSEAYHSLRNTSIKVSIEPPATSPFGTTIRTIDVPAYMLEPELVTTRPHTAHVIELFETAFVFSVPPTNTKIRYSNTGVTKV